MQKNGQYLILLVGILFFSLLPPLPASSTAQTGIGFSYRDFWFYVYEPTTLDFPSMLFDVYNPGNENVTVVCRYESVIGINVSVAFEWDEYTLTPNEHKKNHYAITVNSSLAVTHTLRIVLFTRIQVGNQSGLAGAGIITNKLTYFTADTGALLQINVMDQSHRPRNATVYIYHKGEEATAWTPLEVVNVSNVYTAFLPVGEYQIQAYDDETGIYAERIFTLLANESATILDLYLQLVLIKIGRVRTYHEYGLLNIEFNVTIANHVDPFTFIEIRAGLFNLHEEVLDSVINPQLSLPVVENFILKMEFEGLKLSRGKYRIIAQIVADNGLILAETYQNYNYSPPVQPTEFILWGVIFGGFLLAVVLLTKPQWTKLLEGVKDKFEKVRHA